LFGEVLNDPIRYSVCQIKRLNLDSLAPLIRASSVEVHDDEHVSAEGFESSGLNVTDFG
jgi:hypothetical protein